MQVRNPTQGTMRLADELKAIRDEVRLSQDQLAKIAGSRSTIKAIERGAQVPKPETLRELADGLATDGAGNRCQVKARRYYHRLMFAAGHISELPPDPPAAEPDLGHALGHTSIATTLKTYAHFISQGQRRVASAVGKRLRRAENGPIRAIGTQDGTRESV